MQVSRIVRGKVAGDFT